MLSTGTGELQISERLVEDRKSCGGMVQLESAIAAASGGFPILERRKIASLIDAPQRTEASKSPVVLSLREIAALDVFWKEKGGFLGSLRVQSLAESISKVQPLIVFLPSLPWRDKQEKHDPEKLGYVPVGDVRAAATLRRMVHALSPTLPYQLEEVPSGEEHDAQFGKLFGGKSHSVDALIDNVPQARDATVALVSIGSDRSNLLSKFLLHEFFPDGWPFKFHKQEAERQLLVRGHQALTDHAVICLRRTKHRRTGLERLEVVIAGDRSLSTVGAATEIGSFSDDVPSGSVGWAVVKVTVDHESSRVATSELVSGYPMIHVSGSMGG